MRDIKFKIWVDNERMTGPFDLSQNPVFWSRKLEDGKRLLYTGLKDANGIEVYEGDIVRCSSGCPHEVIWLEEYAGTYVGGMPAWYLSGIRQGYAWSNEEIVIGNIYENKELLGDE